MKIEELLNRFPNGVYKYNPSQLKEFWEFVAHTNIAADLGQQKMGEFYLEVNYKWENEDGCPIYGIALTPFFKNKKYLNQNSDYTISGMVTITPSGVKTPYVSE